MARTSIAVEHDLAQRIRRVRMTLSDRAGHVISMPDTLTVLLDLWDTAERRQDMPVRASQRDPLTGSYMAYLDRAGQ